MARDRADVIPLLGEVFRLYGFEGASIARITAGTGLGKGSLYHFFPGGKEEMAEAVLAEIRDWFETRVFRPLHRDSPPAALERMFDEVDSYFHAGQRICLVGAFALDDSRDRFAAAIAGYFSDWLAALADCLQRSGAGPEEARRIARQVVAGIQGAIVMTRALDDSAHFSAILSTLREISRRD